MYIILSTLWYSYIYFSTRSEYLEARFEVHL